MLFDTHLNVEQFAEDEAEVIQRAKDHGVSRIAVVGFDHETITKALEMSKTYEAFTHHWLAPNRSRKLFWRSRRKINSLIQSENVVAMGEMGGLPLDGRSKPVQIEFLEDRFE